MFVLGLILAASPAVFGGDRDPVEQRLYDFVAVGRSRGKILLATLATPADNLLWRFREIPVSPPESTVREVTLSEDGTKALIVFPNGSPRIFDLTKRITGGASREARMTELKLLDRERRATETRYSASVTNAAQR